MSNTKQYNGVRPNNVSHGPIHPFRVVDIGAKYVVINRGKFYQSGQDGQEIDIAGDLGPKMLEHVWNKFDVNKAFKVSVGDVIYLRIKYADDPETIDSGNIIAITSVKLEKNNNPLPGDNELIWPIAEITAQKNLPDTSIWTTVIDQKWKSDVSTIILGEKEPAGTGGGCEFSTTVEVDVVVGLQCEASSDPDPDVCCIWLTPLFKTLSFCGTVGELSSKYTIICCCDGPRLQSSSSSSMSSSSLSSSSSSGGGDIPVEPPASSSSDGGFTPPPPGSGLVTIDISDPIVTITGADPILVI